MADPRERVFETTDRAAADLTLEVLLAEGFDAALEGVSNHALLGAAPHVFPLAISVPAPDAARARELLAAMAEKGEPVPDEPGLAGAPAVDGVDPVDRVDGVDGDDDGGSSRLSRRSPLLAAGCTFVVPGGCHFYARRPWTALVLVCGWVGAFVLLAASREASWMAAATMIPLLAADLVGGLVALRAENRGRPSSRVRQIAAGVALVTVVAAAPGLPALAEQWQLRRRAEELSTLQITCSPAGISVENLAQTGRLIAVSDPAVLLSHGVLFEQPLRFPLELSDASVRLAPGERVPMPFVDPKLGLCEPGGRGGTAAMGLVFAPVLDSGREQCTWAFEVRSVRDEAPDVDAVFTCPMPTAAAPESQATFAP